MTAAAAAADRLDINRVVRRTLEVLRRNWRALLRPALLYVYLPAVLVGALRPHAGPFGMTTGVHPAWPLVSLLALIPYVLFQGGLIRLTVADVNAEAVTAAEALKVGRERLWPLLGLDVLTGLGVGLGLVLLIVPGVLLALAWCVNGPVLVEERRPVMETFGRSLELTRGSRLNIFAVGLTLLGFEILLSLAIAIVGAPFPRLFADALLWPLSSAVSAVVDGVVISVIYNELRWLQEDRAAGGSVGVA